MVNVLAIGGENRTPADQSPQDGENRLQNRKSERDYRNRNRDQRWSLLRTCQGKGAKQKANEQASRISKKNCGRIEIETQKSKNGACQSQTHDSAQPCL